MGTIQYSQAIKPDTAYLKKIIENSLLSDWAIRIEYHDGQVGINCWQLWDKAFFAIDTSKNVIEAIISCYTMNPRSTIRIYAEKFQPQTRMLFTVYNPQYLPAETELTSQSSTQSSNQAHGQSPAPIRITTQ